MDTSHIPNLSIGALARRTDCKVQTIRFYEQIGVLPTPERSPGGQRRYSLNHLKRLNFVRRARALGFTLKQVRGLLSLADQSGSSCAEVEELARAHLKSVHGRIADLKRMEAVLEEMASRCADGTVPDCPILEALFED